MALSSPRSGRRHGIMADINITPLTDIFLVLLIIFMVTSAAMVQSGANINLPEVDATSPQPREITIAVTPDRRIFVNNQPVDASELEETLRALIAAHPSVPVVLEGDRRVLFGDAVNVLSIAQKAGASEIAIAAERRPGA